MARYLGASFATLLNYSTGRYVEQGQGSAKTRNEPKDTEIDGIFSVIEFRGHPVEGGCG